MKLGNTNKGNTGKTYLMRTSISEKSFSQVEIDRTSDFNAWFIQNTYSLRQEWINKGQFDEDIFTDTYIRICESIGFGDTQIKDYRSYFSRSYYTNYILNKKYESRFQDIEISFLDQEQNGDIHLFESEYKVVVTQLFSKIEDSFSAEESEVFKDFLLWKENQPGKTGGSYREFSKIAKKKPHVVQDIFSRAKKTLQQDKDLNQKISNLYSLL